MATKELNVDILPPEAVVHKAQSLGVKKARSNALTTFMLGILAGVFIALAGEFYTMATFSTNLGYSITRLLGGIVFSLGLILVIITGAELFTGNTLLMIAWMDRKISLRDLLRNWTLVYLGNLVGSLGIVLLVYYSKQWMIKDYGFAIEAINIGVSKTSNDFITAMIRGILANLLVVLAVWLSYAGRTLTDKLLAIVFPVTAFVSSGFEHSIANMYFVPMAILLKGNEAAQSAYLAADNHGSLSLLTVNSFITHNLIPATIGNIIGGGVLVGLVYWFIYLYYKKNDLEDGIIK